MTVPALPAFAKRYLPSRKLLSDMPSEEATIPPTSTCAPGAKRIPLGLVRNTRPLEVRRPKIADGSPPRTRLRMTDEALGCAKLTWAWLPMLKLSQLTIALLEDCVTSMRAPLLLIVACPATISPPVGRVVGAGVAATATVAPPRESTAAAITLMREVQFRVARLDMAMACYSKELAELHVEARVAQQMVRGGLGSVAERKRCTQIPVIGNFPVETDTGTGDAP